MRRWSPGRSRVSRVLLMAAMPLESTTAPSVPSKIAIMRASACLTPVTALSAMDQQECPT